MRVENNRNVSFKGLSIEGVAPVKRVANFLGNKMNIDLINKLESRNVDVFMTQKGKVLRFLSKPYGDLEKFGIEPQLTDKFQELSTNNTLKEKFLSKIANAIKTGEEKFAKIDHIA